MKSTMVKVYGYLRPCAKNEAESLKGAIKALGEEASNVLFLDGDLLNISHEGVYFPLEDFLQALTPLLDAGKKGRIDYLDLEEWTLVRYSIDNGLVSSARRGLNDVLAFSGH